MSDQEPSKERFIVSDEEMAAARARLLEWFARQQALGKRDSLPTEMDSPDAAPPAQSAGGSSSECNEEEPEEPEEPEDQRLSIDDLFPFRRAERRMIDQIEATIRRNMLSAEPSTLKDIAAFLHALQRLPYATPGVSMDLLMTARVDGCLSYVSVELSSEVFRLSTGGSVYSPEVGSDSYSSATFEIETGGFREGTTEDFREWLDQFDAAEGVIEVHGDWDADLTESAPDDGWSRLAAYWERRRQDDYVF